MRSRDEEALVGGSQRAIGRSRIACADAPAVDRGDGQQSARRAREEYLIGGVDVIELEVGLRG